MKKKQSKKTPKLVNFPKMLVFSISILCVVLVATVCTCCYFVKNSRGFTNPEKVGPYLYSVNYRNYADDSEGHIMDDVTSNYACSSVRNGNFYGRNFDYIFNDIPEFVVKVEATKDRHASIGVAMNFSITDNDIESGRTAEKDLAIIPNFTLDGINDAGVIISDNIAPAKDHDPITGTNPGKDNLPLYYVPRYILDHADSADHAVELLKEHNITKRSFEQDLHFMIADKDKTYIAEIINNELIIKEKTGDEQIMTNFFVNIPELTEHASGVERFGILKNNYAMGDDMDGMWHLMAKVRYSNAYRRSMSPVWYSENLTQSIINNPDPAVLEDAASSVSSLITDYWNAIITDNRAPANPAFWHTTHNSVYDIAERKLRVTVQEDYTRYYEFSLD